MSHSLFVDGADASTGSFDIGSQSSSATSGSSGGGDGVSNSGAEWWTTPQSEYVKLGAIDPAIFGLDISDVGGEPDDRERVEPQQPNGGSMFASPVASAGTKPNNFSEWMADPLGKGAAQKPAPKPDHAADKQPATSKASSARKPKADKHNASGGTHSSGVAAPQTLEMGDQIVGERSTKEFPIFNVDQTYEASVLTLQYSGHPSITIASRPERLRPSREGVPAPIVLAFNPTSEEAVSGVITATLRWQLDHRPQEEVRIAVRGIAHHRGSQPHHQRQEDAADAKKLAAETEREAKEEHDLDQKIQKRIDTKDLKDHGGHKEYLSQLTNMYKAAIERLYTRRQIGIAQASTMIQGFERKIPRVVPSLISRLAWAALDSISYGMASNISGLVSAAVGKPGMDSTEDRRPAERPLEGPVRTVETQVSPAIVTLVSQAVKQGFKSAGAAAIGSLKGEPDKPGGSTADDRDAIAQFIAQQSLMFYGDYAQYAASMGDRLFNALMVTSMKTDAQGSFRAMEAATAAINMEGDRAADAQLQSTLQHWVQYVSQVSLGADVGQDGSSVINKAPANHTAGEHAANVSNGGEHALQSFDGLVDVAFVVNAARPDQPARLVSAKIKGVRNAVADSLLVNGRLRPDVAVRAYGTGGGGNAVTPLTVVRDESGSITFTDHMSLELEESSWLSKKAGSRRPSQEAQQQGARQLLEELLSQELPLVERKSGGKSHKVHALETDSES